MADRGLWVALLSLEPWDDVWRRNQYFAANLVRSGAVSRLLFLEPPALHPSGARRREPIPGIHVVPLQLRIPKRLGGLAELGLRMRTGVLRGADVLWVNDPALGVHCLRAGQAAVYDVTDDWRSYDFPPRILRRIVRAEDELARRATTVVCSAELQGRWQERYGIDAAVVHNGVDVDAWRTAEPRKYGGPGPHVGYVGTLQPERLDIDLVLEVADHRAVGQVHLVGPDSLGDAARSRLQAHRKVVLHPPVPAAEVPSWTKGLDVVLSPHRITPFTLSLDAIKSYEYLVSGRSVVATPTSGFQHLRDRPGVRVAAPTEFAVAVDDAVCGQPTGAISKIGDLDWATRANQFASFLRAARDGAA